MFRFAAVLLVVYTADTICDIYPSTDMSKKLLSKYWGQYTALGDTFLENLQGLTTLKIYRADDFKNDEMNVEAEKFRKNSQCRTGHFIWIICRFCTSFCCQLFLRLHNESFNDAA